MTAKGALSRVPDVLHASGLEGVLDALPHGICLWGADGRVVRLNDAYLRLMEGASLRVGDHMSDVVRRRARAGEYGPGDPEAIYAREMARDLSRPQARRRVRANGTALDVHTVPMPDGGHMSVVTDVTELWRAEEEARNRAVLLETAMSSMRHGLVVYGPDQRVRAFNALAPRLAGHAPHEVWSGQSLDELISSLHALGRLGAEPGATRLVEAARAIDRSKPHRTVRRTPDGQVLEVSSDPTPDGGFIITHVDITAVARAEAEAKDRAAVLQVMLENMRHGICLFDAEARIVTANALAANMSGLPPDAFRPGRHISELRAQQVAAGELVEGWRPPHAAPDDRTPTMKAPDHYVRPSPSGRMIEVSTDHTPDGGYVRTYTDVTEDRRIRGELERARVAAEAASDAKSRFLATMSHELRTPLAAVIGFAEALLDSPPPEDAAEYATSVRDAGRHLLALIEDILDVARAGRSGDGSAAPPLDTMTALAEAASSISQAAADAGLALTLDAAPGLPALDCDARRLRRILAALLSNAVKFTEPGGKVTLSATREADGTVLLHVADTGIGMAPEDIPRAFEPFTQLDQALSRRFGGSGLGLHLARLLTEAMGASLTLDSAPGVGTTATLRLPAAITISAAVPQETT